MKIFSREFWGSVLIWLGVLIFLGVIYDTIRPVFPRKAPYAFIESIQAFFRKEPAAGPEGKPEKTVSPRRLPPSPVFQGNDNGKMLTIAVHRPGGSYHQWVWAIKPDRKTGRTVRVEMAHAAGGSEGGFTILAYADTDGDGKPDKKIAESDFLTVEEPGQWSTFTFTAEEDALFVGNIWPPGNETVVFRGNGLWPREDSPFEGRFFYRISGANSRSAGPAFTNLRVSFSN